MVSNGILVICIILSLIFGGSALLFILCLWAVFKDKKERKIMIEGKGLVESLRQLGKYSEFKPNYLLLAADRIEELSGRVEVVRCINCKYYKTVEDIITSQVLGFCAYNPYNSNVKETDFCSYGERKESEVDTE